MDEVTDVRTLSSQPTDTLMIFLVSRRTEYQSVQSQKEVPAYLTCRQILPFGFVEQH